MEQTESEKLVAWIDLALQRGDIDKDTLVQAVVMILRSHHCRMSLKS